MTDRRRVVITGMDTINPLGDTLDGYHANLLAGKSGIKRWTSLDTSRVDCKIGGDLGDYDCLAALAGLAEDLGEARYKRLKKLFRTMTFPNKTAVLTTLKAVRHAGLLAAPFADPYRVSAIVGGHNFNSRYVLAQSLQFLEEPSWIDPLYGVEALDPNIPGTLSEVLGIRGPAFTVGAACASGNIALREAFRDIVSGESDTAIVSGPVWDMNESDLNAMGYLDALVVKPEFQDLPEQASRPFDVRRCGFVPSHGAATLVIEEYGQALRRGATIHAEVLAVAANSNANHLPAPCGEAQATLMRGVLAMAGKAPEEVGYVNCHATGTPLGDIEELSAVKAAFGAHAKNLKLNALKSMLGHTCWAAPLVETIGGILQLAHGRLARTINIDEAAPEVDLDVLAAGPATTDARLMLKNSFGFGGLNCCSLLAVPGNGDAL